MYFYFPPTEEYKRKQVMKSEDNKAMASLKWSTAELKQVKIGFFILTDNIFIATGGI